MVPVGFSCMTNKGRGGSLMRDAGDGCLVGCNWTKLGGGGKERNMKSSSSKLYVFGVNEGYQDPFFGEVETIFGEEMMSGCIAGCLRALMGSPWVAGG